MSTTKRPEIDTAPSGELHALVVRLERLVAVKRAVDEASGEDGAGMVMLSGREIELMAEALRAAYAKAWSEGR